jgi:hypothetical protein
MNAAVVGKMVPLLVPLLLKKGENGNKWKQKRNLGSSFYDFVHICEGSGIAAEINYAEENVLSDHSDSDRVDLYHFAQIIKEYVDSSMVDNCRSNTFIFHKKERGEKLFHTLIKFLIPKN